ncbi:MAG: GTPase HflX [Candidatus Thermoplasmatota archaeon]|nr:GTPase HflX [Candidatus Thermoplasmatota archaeon]
MVDESYKKAYLAWITPDEELLDEMIELCGSAGYEIVETIHQKRSVPDPRYYLGPGKIKEIEPSDEVDHLIIASELSPSQMYNISSATGLTVIDRTRVILDIFRKRAYSPEARLQLEIADLRYQMPLMREYIHQGKLSERPGFMAGGEYKIDYYYELSKKRMSELRSRLESLRKKHGIRRKQRKRRGTHTISIAGYTNAGKSTLMNRLMDTQVERKSAEEGSSMFTTIATTTRSMKGSRNCIITDTVGFISDLPPWLVEGFMSTLEEIFSSEVILLVIDASDSKKEMKRKIEDSLSVLRQGGTEGSIVLVLNKCDLVSEVQVPIEDALGEEDLMMISDIALISASEEWGMDELVERIHQKLPPLMNARFVLPPEEASMKLLSEIRMDRDVKVRNLPDGSMVVDARMEDRWARSTAKSVLRIGGRSHIQDEEDLEKS